MAVDRHIQRIAGLLQIALLIGTIDAGGFHPETQLRARRHDGAGIAGIGAGLPHVLVQQILKFNPLALEARGRHIGDIVGNDFNIGLLSLHSGGRDIECEHMR